MEGGVGFDSCLVANKWPRLSAGNNNTERQQLRRWVSGFTPWTDPVATMLRSTSLLTRSDITPNIRLLRAAAHLL